jgi:MraZ protein
MFRGHSTSRVDDKGRIKVPADFKRVVDEKYGSKFYITSTDGVSAQIYPLEEWEQIEKKIRTLASMTSVVKQYVKNTSYYGHEVEIDGQGRVLLPSLLREKANLKGELSVVGFINHLEVRIHEELRAEVEGSPITPEQEEELAKLGLLGF